MMEVNTVLTTLTINLMNKDDKQIKEIANKLGMTSKQLIDEVTIRINKKRAIAKATANPYKKRDKSQVRVRPTKR